LSSLFLSSSLPRFLLHYLSSLYSFPSSCSSRLLTSDTKVNI
jgi:hypothetical protein